MAVDDLFDGPSAAPEDPLPRLRRWLYWTGTFVLGGACCCLSPIGALLAIFVWARAGDEVARAEAGLGPPGTQEAAKSLRNQAFGLMVISFLALFIQCLGYGALAGSQEVLQTVQGWLAELLNAILPEDAGRETGILVGVVMFLLVSVVFGAVSTIIRRISERAVFGEASPRKTPPRRPLPAVPHDTMQAYIDKEIALRELYPDALVVHPELGALDDGQRYTVGEWPMIDGRTVILPEGLTFVALVVATGEQAATLWRAPKPVLKLLGAAVERRESPCVHLVVTAPAEAPPGFAAEVKRMPEFKP